MSNRFHNKYHKTNHHTDATSGDIDSSHDPIASPDYPFQGNFSLNGALSGSGTITVPSIGGVGASVALTTDLDLDGNTIIGLTLSGMNDVTVTTPASGEVLLYNGSNWINSTYTIPANSVGMTEIDNSIWGDGLVSGSDVSLDYATSGEAIARTDAVKVLTPATLPSSIQDWEITPSAAGSFVTTKVVWIQIEP